MFQKTSSYYVILAATLATIAGFSYSPLAHQIIQFFAHDRENAALIFSFFEVGILFLLGFYAFYLAKNIHIPSFVIAIFLGIAAKPFLEMIITAQQGQTLNTLVAIGAALILFSGGIETPFRNFCRLAPKILLLSFVGLSVTAIFFSYGVWGLGAQIGVPITIGAAVLLGAILASTDPAAIVPVLRILRFRNKDTKDIVISESALTDVTGALLTLTFLGMAIAASSGMNELPSIMAYYRGLLSTEVMIVLIKELFFGILFGFLGYLLLAVLVKFKHHHEEEFEVDSAFFLFVPLMIFAVTLAFHGSGYLAAFIIGLLFTINHKIKHTEHFFNQIVEGYLKPMIFILLGALVDIPALFEYAVIGIISGLFFMFVIRPIAVFVSLGIYTRIRGVEKMSMRELLFISFVRETGAIPAVLLVTLQSAMSNTPALQAFLGNGILEIGMWVILLTLIIEPMLTPWVASRLDVAEIMRDDEQLNLENITQTSSVILATRGYTFLERIDTVVDWSVQHSVSFLIVLLCLEHKYSPEEEEKVRKIAEKKFVSLKKIFPEMQFHFTSRRGLLQENISEIAAQEGSQAVAIFVGKKMLDYRLSEIKKLTVPLRFMD